jgi:hypothetical protein
MGVNQEKWHHAPGRRRGAISRLPCKQNTWSVTSVDGTGIWFAVRTFSDWKATLASQRACAGTSPDGPVHTNKIVSVLKHTSIAVVTKAYRLQTFIAHERNTDSLEQLLAQGIGQLEHLAVVVAGLEKR